ncbi:MAG TPA: CPBP family intramembrane glutamic endopeptidase [Ignavibacteriaceae bacterium]|nr:CPBP family intramembrane glutamic endopeptidase [Ignavibacteriaceae bacterium]
MDELNKDKDQEENQLLPGEKKNTGIIPKINPVGAAFIGLFGGFFLYQVVGSLLMAAVFGFDLEKAPINSFRLMTIAGQILYLLFPALLFTRIFYEDVTEIIRFKKPNWIELILFVIGIFALSPLLQSYLYIQNFFIEQLASKFHLIRNLKEFADSFNKTFEIDKFMGNLMRADNLPERLLVVSVIAVTPAICEEVMFRGFIQRSFEFKLRPLWAAFITAIFFGLYHFNIYGTIPLIALGFYFGFAAYTSNSIFIPMLLHFINNFIAVMVNFILGEEDPLNSNTPKDFQLASSVMLFFIFLFLFAGIIFLIKYYSRKKQSA